MLFKGAVPKGSQRLKPIWQSLLIQFSLLVLLKLSLRDVKTGFQLWGQNDYREISMGDP